MLRYDISRITDNRASVNREQLIYFSVNCTFCRFRIVTVTLIQWLDAAFQPRLQTLQRPVYERDTFPVSIPDTMQPVQERQA